MFELVALAFTVLANLTLGLFVLLKNPRILASRLFFFLTSIIALWSTANYLSTHPYQLSWIRIVLFFGGLLNLSVFLNFLLFPNNKLSNKAKKWAKLAIYASIVVLPLTLTSLVFKELKFVNGNPEPVPNIAIPLFLLHTLILIGASIAMLIYKQRNATGNTRSQLNIVLLGIATTFGIIVITNFLLVIAFNFTALVPLGPAFTLIFTSSFAYAIVRHRLFDIRAAVARSVAYVLSFGAIGLIYGTIVLGLFGAIGTDNLSRGTERATLIGFALITAATFPAIKRFFDKLTKKLFYADAYDSEEMLDDINTLLVGQIDLELLLKGITNIIEENLKTSYCVFVIRETAYEPARVVGSDKHHFNDERIAELRKLAPHAHRKILITDELDEYKDQLEDILKDLDVSVLIRLVSNTSTDMEGMGFLVIGPKKNGTIYSGQDQQVLDILANEMVIAVENALRYEEIQKFADTLQQKVDEQTKELRKKNEKLKQMDETKDEFISMASHQLRTPLTSVKGYLSMVLEGDTGNVPEMQKKLLDQAFVSSQRMVYLIADLLNVSRLKTGKFIIDAVPTQLDKVIEEETGQLIETAKARKLELNYQKPKDFPELMMDETKIRQVAMNFMDNAIYYTPSGGKIDVKLEDKDKTIEFTVNDNGIGIPKWDQVHLFSKFYRAGNAKKARPDGTGLGLFMAKKVIVAQGGSIIFKSEEGKGSTFGFALEKAKLEEMAKQQDKKEEVTHPKPTELEAEKKPKK